MGMSYLDYLDLDAGLFLGELEKAAELGFQRDLLFRYGALKFSFGKFWCL